MQKSSRKETYLVTNTLNCLPFVLDGLPVLIDLRNENSIAGRVDASGTDGQMNINLVDVVFIDLHGFTYAFDEFMIGRRMIRQIHIPSNIDAESAIRDWIENGRIPPRRVPLQLKGKMTFKQKRAAQRHKEVLSEMQQAKREQKEKVAERDS